MKRANHSCTVEWIGAYIEQKRVLWVIMEYMDCGSLADVLENHGELFMTEPQIAIVMRDVCHPSRSRFFLTARWARRSTACTK